MLGKEYNLPAIAAHLFVPYKKAYAEMCFQTEQTELQWGDADALSLIHI